jgi:hypothetical protein
VKPSWRTAGSRPDRILLAASQPTTDQADPPAVSPADPVADSPGTLRIGDPPMGILAAQGGSPGQAHVSDSLAVMGCRSPLAV